MIASKVELTMVAFKPSTAAIALTMSGSMPITVCPSGAMNSFGAYCASVPTISVPLDLIAAGTCAAIDALALGVGTVAAVLAVDDVDELLLLPQPAIASTASAGTPTRMTSLLIGNLLPRSDDGPVREAGQVYGRLSLSCV